MAKTKRDESGAAPQAGFEESLRKLEAIATRLESGDVPLEEMIRLYEEGIRIQKSCAALLAEAKLRIEELTQDLDRPAESRNAPAVKKEASSPASAPTEARDDEADAQEEIPF